jgi:phage major head subunit gpT-like protein
MTVDTVALEKGLSAAFKKAQDELNGSGYRQDMRGLIVEVPSTGSSERYGWFGDVPAVQEWIGDETSGDLQDYEYEIKNRDFYTAIGIDRNEIADDRAGILLPQIQSMVQAIADHKLDLVADLILNGITGLAFDGVPFFSNRAVNDNLLAGSGITLANL